MRDEKESRFIDSASGLQIITLVDCACRHPLWFTLHGTFAEVAAFLNGYYSALDGREGEEERELVAEWRGFCLWLAKKLGVVRPERVDEVLSGVWFFGRIRSDCPDEKTALARLDDWWAEYWAASRE